MIGPGWLVGAGAVVGASAVADCRRSAWASGIASSTHSSVAESVEFFVISRVDGDLSAWVLNPR